MKQTKEHIEKRAAARRRGGWFSCEQCGKSMWRKPYDIAAGNNRFCSKSCYFIWQSGKPKKIDRHGSYKGSGNPNWKGGITPENKKIRSGDQYKEWRCSVFMRDDWTCQKCGKRSKANEYLLIHAHHIKPFATHKHLRFELSNGITLCKKCHDKEPKGKEVYYVT